ncbi:MBL fold metallo-hydrolase [Catellatospora citrea]|uniref:MBL fold metallo-hydrolase n=1 Tax=Catellatospora citrea TaxID=53366 RepID=UPI0033EC274B
MEYLACAGGASNDAISGSIQDSLVHRTQHDSRPPSALRIRSPGGTMADADIHEIAPNLCVIEGHHPHRMWEDPDIPTIAVYRGASTLYLLDTGVGPQQRSSILAVAQKHGPADEVVILSSHGHIDHLGNNDVVDDIAATGKRNYFPRAGRPGLEPRTFFRAMYERGAPYFDYIDGLDLDADTVGSLLRGIGADPRATPDTIARLGDAVEAAGVVPAISKLLPGLVVDILLSTYPPVHIRAEAIHDYEELGPARDITIGQTTWSGWSFGGGEVHVFQTGGHSAGGCVFYVPEHRFLMFADETTGIPIWADTDPANTIRTMRGALEMMDSGHLSTVCAGHRPMLPQSNDEARATLNGVITGAEEFSATVRDGIAKHPDGVCIDELYAELVSAAAPESMISVLKRLQFPVFATFLKLTLANECLLRGYRQGRDDKGRITFRA